MAKKSAKSKGYRKTVGKKPYLSKRDIIMLCALLAAVAVGAILLFSYDDGALKTKDGQLVDAGENWLVVNGAASGGRRYYKMAELGELEGYARESETIAADDNLRIFRYTLEDEASGVQSITVSCNAANAERQAAYYASLFQELSPTEPAAASAGDVNYIWFSYDNIALVDAEAAEEADASTDASADSGDASDGEVPAEESEAGAGNSDGEALAGEGDAAAADDAADTLYQRGFNLYADAQAHGAISVSIVYGAATADALPDEAALKDIAAQALSAITFESKK